jgi:hypothetical protein
MSDRDDAFSFAKEIVKQTCLLIGFYQKKVPLSSEITDLVKQAYLIRASSSRFETVISVLEEVCEQERRPISREKAQEFVHKILAEKGIKTNH